MKKIIWMISILGCMLLTACGRMNLQNGEETEFKSLGTSEQILYEEDGVKLVIRAVKSVGSDRNAYVLYIENQVEEERDVTLSNLIFNNKYLVSETETFFLDPLEKYKNTMEEMSDIACLEDIESIDSLAFHIKVRNESFEVINEKDINLEFEESLVYSTEYVHFLGASAAKQVLFEDEAVKITLIEWGKDPDSYSVSAIVHIENRSEKTIPAKVSGITLNGIFFDGSDPVNFIKPGESCYGVYSVSESTIEDEGITAINDVRIMVMTDESQNTGIVNFEGGEWYTVDLEEKGEITETFVEGELLVDTEDVRISYIGQEEQEWSSGGGYYQWKLAVVNGSSENVEISMVDLLVDGVVEETWSDMNTDCSIYLADSDVGAESNRYVYISMSCYDEMIPRPEIQFRFQIRSMAGGAIISTSEEVITLTPDQE